MTNSQRTRDNAVMMSSTTPSAKYSCSGSPLMFRNGKTAIDGLSGRTKLGAGTSCDVAGSTARGSKLCGGRASMTSPTESEPFAENCPDQALFLPAVTNGLADRVDMTGQG